MAVELGHLGEKQGDPWEALEELVGASHSSYKSQRSHLWNEVPNFWSKADFNAHPNVCIKWG